MNSTSRQLGFVEKLPQPLAKLAAALRASDTDPRGAHAAALAAFEAAVRWCTLIFLKARADLGLPTGSKRQVQTFFQRPSFGSWVGVLLRFTTKLPSEKTDRREYQVLELVHDVMQARSVQGTALVTLMKDPEGPVPKPDRGKPWRKVFEQLPHYRNDFVGHAGFLQDDHFERFGPLLRDAGMTFFELLGERLPPLRVAHPCDRGFRVLDYTNETPREIGAAAALPAGVEESLCYLASEIDGSCVLSLADLLAEEKEIIYLFDRSPKQGGNEYLDFASSTRVRHSGIAIPDGHIAQALSTDNYEGRDKETGIQRVDVRFRPLRRSARVREPITFRVSLRNLAPEPLQCQVRLGDPQLAEALASDSPDTMRASWAFHPPSNRTLEIGVGEFGSALLAASPLSAGILQPPFAVVQTDHDRAATVEPSIRTFQVRRPSGDKVVGREDVLSELYQFLDEVETHPGRLVSLIGEPGIGKSSTLELMAQNARRKGIREIRGTAHSAGGQPLKIFHDLLRDLLGVVESDHTDASLREFVAQGLSEYVGEDSPTVQHFTGALLGDSAEEPTSEQLRHYRWFRLFAAVAKEAPLLLMVDDVHEAGIGSLELLESLLDRCQSDGVPIAVVAGMQPLPADIDEPRKKALGPLIEESKIAHRVFELEGLSRTAIEELIEQTYPGSTFRDDMPWLVDALQQRSEGNPLFLREMLQALSVDNGSPAYFRREDNGQWRQVLVTSFDRLLGQLPLHFSDSLLRRLETLPDDCKPVLQYAALMGNRFSIDVLERLLDDADILDEGLDALEAAGVIEPDDPELTHYRFKNTLICEAVVEEHTSSARRATLRKRREIARAMLEEYGDSAAMSEPIGTMLALAGRHGEALPYLLRAVTYHWEHGQYADANALFSRARDLHSRIDEMPAETRFQFCFLAGEVALRGGHFEECRRSMEQAEEIARELDDFEKQAICFKFIGGAEMEQGNLETSAADVTAALEAAKRAQTPLLLADIKNLHGILSRRRGRFEEAEASGEAALKIAQEHASPLMEFKSSYGLAKLRFDRSEFEEAECLARSALALAEELDNIDHVSIVLVFLATIAFTRGDFENACKDYSRAVETQRRLQNRVGLSRNYLNLALAEKMLGRLELALQAISRSIDIRREMEDWMGEATSLLERAILLRKVGDISAAAKDLEQAGALGKKIESDPIQVMAQIQLGRLALLSGDLKSAERALSNYGSESVLPGHRYAGWLLELELARAHKSKVSADRITEGRELRDRLVEGFQINYQCLLTAGLAHADPDRDSAIDDLECFLEQHTDLPPGAALDHVYEALATLLKDVDPEKAESALREARAMLRSRADLIENPERRQGFLDFRARGQD